MEVSDYIGLAQLVVFLLFVVLAVRSGKRQFRNWSDHCRLEGRNQLAADLEAMGGSAVATQSVTVVQHGDGTSAQSAPSGGASSRVLDGVRPDLHGADSEAAALERLCRRYGLDYASLRATALDADPNAAVVVDDPAELERICVRYGVDFQTVKRAAFPPSATELVAAPWDFDEAEPGSSVSPGRGPGS